MLPEGQYLDTVELQWPRKRKESSSFGERLWEQRTAAGVSEERVRTAHQSQETLPVQCGHAVVGNPVLYDPWVRRCRIAAFVGGVILLIGLVVTVIVLSTIPR